MRRAAVERLLADRDRAHAKEVDRLLAVIADQNDRLMHLAGRTWQQPPTELKPELEQPAEFEPRRFVAV